MLAGAGDADPGADGIKSTPLLQHHHGAGLLVFWWMFCRVAGVWSGF
jgi:hypothetical protein